MQLDLTEVETGRSFNLLSKDNRVRSLPAVAAHFRCCRGILAKFGSMGPAPHAGGEASDAGRARSGASAAGETPNTGEIFQARSANDARQRRGDLLVAGKAELQNEHSKNGSNLGVHRLDGDRARPCQRP